MGCGMVEYMELVLSVRDRFEMVNNRVTEVMIRSLSKQLCWTVPLPCVETFNCEWSAFNKLQNKHQDLNSIHKFSGNLE